MKCSCLGAEDIRGDLRSACQEGEREKLKERMRFGVEFKENMRKDIFEVEQASEAKPQVLLEVLEARSG